MPDKTKHARDRLLDAIKNLIASNDVPVERSRVWPVAKDDYPRYFVFWIDETIDWSQSTSDGTMRIMQVGVEAARQIATDDDVESTMQIDLRYLEEALVLPEIEGAVDAMLDRIELSIHHHGEIPLGVAALTLTVQYRTLSGKSDILV